ncbi:unnamed protein product [Amoebophrya sp. A25]|nr:unnamed protein product [Amoebophrya sp. A25]|eukprot:GSA25T00000342001.1
MSDVTGFFQRAQTFSTFEESRRMEDIEIEVSDTGGGHAVMESFESRFWEKNQVGTGVKAALDPGAEAKADDGDHGAGGAGADHLAGSAGAAAGTLAGSGTVPPGGTTLAAGSSLAAEQDLLLERRFARQPTLAEVKRDAKRQAAVDSALMRGGADGDEARMMAKRVKISNMTEADSVLRETKLITYFCKFCGEWVLITDAGKLARMPVRSFDSATILEETRFLCRLNANGAKRKTIVLKKNAQGVVDNSCAEQQYRFQCKGCGSLVGYRQEPLGETAMATYLYQDTLVEKQTMALKFVNKINI